MLLRNDHPEVPLEGWRAFKEAPPPSLIKEVIDRGEIKLPKWYVPSARGVAIASDDLFRTAGYRSGSRRPPDWRRADVGLYLGPPFLEGPDGLLAMPTARQYAGQWWWTVERWRGRGHFTTIPDVLVADFGSTPIFCRNSPAAMRLAEHFHLNNPPQGLRWIAASPDDTL